MKRILTLLVLITLSISAYSQKDLCFRTGLNLAKHRGDVFPKNTYKIGLNAGFTYDIESMNNLFFRPGLYFTIKGTRNQIKHDNNSPWIKCDYNQNDVEMPLLIAYKIKANSTFAIDFQAEPYIAYGFGGHQKQRPGKFKQRTFERHNNESEGYFRRLDVGFNFGAGIDINRFYVGAAFDLGLLKLRESQRVLKPNCLMFNVGYYL